MTYGPKPWQQTSWDARAAGNFICGGAGAGLMVSAALSGVQGAALTWLALASLALIGLGLFCVFLELGRPLRSFNVIFNPRTSWMSREALTAGLLFAAGLAAAAGSAALVWVAAALALVFVYCQARMLQAAKGIPAWREPLLVPLIVITGLAEGGGVCLALCPLAGAAWPTALLVGYALVVLVRLALWQAYRSRLDGAVAPTAALALDRAGRLLQRIGTPVPLALLVLIAVGVPSGAQAALLGAIAGLAAALPGAYFKFALVTRAGFNQGFALVHLPVRGQPR
jgi:phenylacetyl-CoA:acceptor oxidoreductase subunit 2